MNDRPFEAGVESGVDHDWHAVSFADTYDRPTFIADVQTRNGGDTCTVRYRNLTGDGVEVKIEEETSGDSETWHVTEDVGYLVVDGATASPTGYGLGGYGAGGYGN